MASVKGSTDNDCHYPKCPSARRLRMFEKTQELLMKVLPVPGGRPMKQLAISVHFVRCDGLLVHWSVEGCPEPGLRINDTSRIHWSQHLLTTQSKRPNGRATRLEDHPAFNMPLILPLSNFDNCSYSLRKRRNGMSTSALPL
ncbi:uncharacterized protein TNCV_1419771 [Trichonephila clavipes]|nr:uncharacterized protein TNCV_1419771 [Trichonephila clavipes]